MPVSSFPSTQDGIGRATRKLLGPLLLTSPLKYLPRGQAGHWEGHPQPATPARGWILFFLYCFLRLSPQAPGLPHPGPPKEQDRHMKISLLHEIFLVGINVETPLLKHLSKHHHTCYPYKTHHKISNVNRRHWDKTGKQSGPSFTPQAFFMALPWWALIHCLFNLNLIATCFISEAILLVDFTEKAAWFKTILYWYWGFQEFLFVCFSRKVT